MWQQHSPVKAIAMTEAEKLRKRACWYRDFAKLSTSGERISRLALADFFERKAQEAENCATARTEARASFPR